MQMSSLEFLSVGSVFGTQLPGILFAVFFFHAFPFISGKYFVPAPESMLHSSEKSDIYIQYADMLTGTVLVVQQPATIIS